MDDSVSVLLQAAANEPQPRSLHDQVNDAALSELVAKFGPTIPPAGVERCTSNWMAAGSISSEDA